MFFRAKRAVRRAWFNLHCASVRRTAPILTNDNRFTLVSMVCHGETLMYLLAAKSFCRQMGSTPRIVVLNDGSLTSDDRATIAGHILNVEIVPIAEIANDACPKGSCWERLLLISDLAQDCFVVQLDSDTLTLRPVPEVAEAISSNRSFTLLGDRSYPEVESMAEACARLKSNTSSMVQAVCERSFDLLPESTELKYIRGNAGFSGFARGSIDREKVEWFSDLMRQLARDKWDEWGSEQVTSSLLIANSAQPVTLPFPKYASYWAHPEVNYQQSAFIHFIGPHRFENGLYASSAKQVLRDLAVE